MLKAMLNSSNSVFLKQYFSHGYGIWWGIEPRSQSFLFLLMLPPNSLSKKAVEWQLASLPESRRQVFAFTRCHPHPARSLAGHSSAAHWAVPCRQIQLCRQLCTELGTNAECVVWVPSSSPAGLCKERAAVKHGTLFSGPLQHHWFRGYTKKLKSSCNYCILQGVLRQD